MKSKFNIKLFTVFGIGFLLGISCFFAYTVYMNKEHAIHHNMPNGVTSIPSYISTPSETAKVDTPLESAKTEHIGDELDVVNEETGDIETYMPVDRVRLSLEQSVQENSYYCVPACLQMVLKYKGINKTQSELAKELKTDPVTGTEYLNLAEIANKYLFGHESVSDNEVGYHIQTITRYSEDENLSAVFEKRVREDISTNDPVFVAIDVNALYPELTSGNHMIVLTGYALYSGTDNIAYYYYIDPSYVVQDETYGGLKIVTKEELMNAIIVNDEPAYIW